MNSPDLFLENYSLNALPRNKGYVINNKVFIYFYYYKCWEKLLKKRKRKFIVCELYFVLLMKSHLQSYPCPLQINSFWNLGFLLGITILLQIKSLGKVIS
mmetsp:Transcript_84357/g.236196  ORF Transcript_84357/g.236196 Transcript_84357/m.236196 type:complete len:100 (-) Transcript_84357:1383-1682(-)